MKKSTIVGIIIFIVIILAIVGIKVGKTSKNTANSNEVDDSELTTVYVATGGGKEDFIADEDVKSILRNKYKLNVVYDSWSNGKTILWPLIREAVGKGNESLAATIQADLKDDNQTSYTINSAGVTRYDALFTSDQRFYDYYKLAPDSSKGESQRYSVLKGGLTLNTPIVIYSWSNVVDSLEQQGIVTEQDGVYYISDMNKMIDTILADKKWSEVGLSQLYGNVNIASTDPVSSSPGATYYGLLLSIMCGGEITDQNIDANLEKLKSFYIKSGYMNNTPADLFERYLKTGMGGEPMIVDYEKSMINFATSNPDGFNQVKDSIRVLYPVPTMWNSHCIASFTENGNKFYEAFEDPEIQKIAWNKYGFRTGITGGSYDVSQFGIGIPKQISSTVTNLTMVNYNKLIDYLKNAK